MTYGFQETQILPSSTINFKWLSIYMNSNWFMIQSLNAALEAAQQTPD
jgi:hypothetical protein